MPGCEGTGGRSKRLAILIVCLFAASCASRPASDSAPKAGSEHRVPADAVPRQEPRRRYGNPPVYEVYGVRYTVMDSSYDYKERGVASWYGKKFHGKATSSQEPYDMYAMTAAHKTLPLPTYVRVRNLKNNKSIVVRVNDRGPFIDNRIIDLSYSAAKKLDMIVEGTSLVEVTALSYDKPVQAVQEDVPAQSQASAPESQAFAPEKERDIFVQVGAFGDVDNAKRRYALLKESGVDHAFVHKDDSGGLALYRIRIGPINGVQDYDALVVKLNSIGITQSHLVTD